jgi:MFS family permease
MTLTPNGAPTQRFGNLHTFDSFKIPAYRMFFLGMIGQWSSFSMEAVARSYLIYLITGSAAMLGLVSLASAVPMICLSLFGGAIADRMPKKRLIQLSQVAMSVVSLGNGIAISSGYLGPDNPGSWWVLMVGAVIMGTIMALAMPSRQAIIPELVRRDQIMNAVSLNTLGMSFFQLVGPAIAGFVIDRAGYAAVFYAMAVLNTSAIVFTSFLPRTTPSAARRQSVLKDVGEGFKYIVEHQTIFLVLIFFVASVLLAMPYQMMMPIFAKDILKVGVAGQGTLMSVSGIGALAASLTLASLPSRRRGLTLLLSNIVMGLALVVFAFSTSWPLSLGMMVFVGIGRIGNNTAGTALLQSHTDPVYLGRVMSLMMMNFGLSGLGTFFAGVMAQSISAPWAIGGLAMILVVLSIGGFLLVPRLRKMD